MRALYISGAVCFVLGFCLGAPLGLLHMKWAVDSELRDLRAKLITANKDGTACCNAAYVAIKYRPDCHAEAKP